MTYGWAILIIVIVAAVLYSLGIFNPTSFVATESVTGFAGLGSIEAQCQAGGLAISLGNSIGNAINITGITVTVNGNTYSTIFPSYAGYASDYNIQPSMSNSFMLVNSCPNNTGHFSATVTVSYTEPYRVFPGPYQSTGTISGASVTQYPLYTSSLVGYWPFDDGSGTTISSLVGNIGSLTQANSDNGTGGVSWQAGNFGSSVSMNGGFTNQTTGKCLSGDCPYFSSSGSVSLSGALTISLWVKPNTALLPWMSVGIVGNGGCSTNSIQISYGGSSYSNNQVFLELGNSTNGCVGSISGGSLTIGQWNFVVAVVNDNTHSDALYVNNNLIGTNSFVGQDNLNLEPRLGGGIWSTYYNGKWYVGYLDGQVDDLRIYDVPLGTPATSALYRSSSPNFEH